MILVQKGWRQTLATAMGKQLLILMTLIAGADAKKQLEPPSEELKASAFTAIRILIQHLVLKDDGRSLFNDVGSKSVVDQLAYLLLEAVTTETSDQVQLAAAEALFALISAISNRILLASLLPRTASSLSHSLRSSTESRRTRKVLTSYLKSLTYILKSVLADAVVFPLPAPMTPSNNGEPAAANGLDESWLRATASQVNLVVIQVLKLRNHNHSDVRWSVAELCLMLISDCAKSLPEAVAVSIDATITIASMQDDNPVTSKLEALAASHPDLAQKFAEKLYEWVQSLPRTMQSNDDSHRAILLGKSKVALALLARQTMITDALLRLIVNKLIDAIAVLEQTTKSDLERLSEPRRITLQSSSAKTHTFHPLIMTESSQSATAHQLGALIETLRQVGLANTASQLAIDRTGDLGDSEKLAGTWLAMACLRDSLDQQSILQLIQDQGTDDALSRPGLVSELYTSVLPSLVKENTSKEWRIAAMAIECTVLQAQQLEVAYRPELVDSLYPILSLLGSSNERLRHHAMTGLENLAQACMYSSTGDMLIENVDYLINAVGMKLNSFEISPQAPQVLLMMLKLCGARIIPYVDDLIESIFSALDNFHGYPEMVEILFRVLKAVVDESKKQPQLALMDNLVEVDHRRLKANPGQIYDILEDLKKRKIRKRKARGTDDEFVNAPRRPWKTFESEMDALEKDDSQLDTDHQEETPAGTSEEGGNGKLSKSHDLLLSIARATAPHLSSPSPQVRSILLQMLEEVSPLLAKHENTFLPLINAVWPAVVPRLLEYDDDAFSAETSYNICAAADTISTLCQGAGSFMSSRMEEIFPKLRQLFEKMKEQQQGKPSTTSTSLETGRIVSTQPENIPYPRSSRSRILASLVRLLTSVLAHVRVSADVGDEILGMIVPFAHDGQDSDVRRTLEIFNEDSFWLWRRMNRTGKGAEGGRPEGGRRLEGE